MNSIVYKCEVCGKSHNGAYGSGRFCGYKCKQKYASLKGQKKANEASKLKCSKACECPYCNKHFESKKDFFKHDCLKKPKKEYTWVCSICNEQFPTRQKMQEHRKTNHSIQRGFPANTHTKIHWICSFCNKESYTPLSAKNLHEKYCKANPNALKYIGHKVSEETKKKISETCKNNKLSGGYRKGSGRGKKGTYKGYYCDSSWELAYVIYNLDHNIKFERNEKLFPYEFNGEQHKYKPDFIENGIYVEVKGYFTEQVKAKEFAFPYQLKYIDKNTIKPYLEYVEQTYGKDFIRLYE